MTACTFRDFILEQLDRVDRLDQLYRNADFDMPVEAGEAFGSIAATVADKAARLGHHDLVEHGLGLGSLASYEPVKTYLARCLAAVPEPHEPVPIGPTLDVDEVAAMLGISTRSVWRRREDGTIPAPIKVGKSVRWRRSDVEAFISGN